MLKNPYSTKIDSATPTGTKLQCDIDPHDKSLIMSLRPHKGTIQLVVNNLIRNLCNDLRKLHVHGYRVDGDDVLSILCEPRPINESQFFRLGHSTIGTVDTISAGLFNSGGRPTVRKKAPKSKTKSPNFKVGSDGGEQQPGAEVNSEENNLNPTES